MTEFSSNALRLFSRWFAVLMVGMLGAFSAQAQLTADFTANVTSGCAPLVVNFTDASTGGPTSWSWDFGNGGGASVQNPSAVFLLPGTYTVQLTVSNGTQSNTRVKTGYINVYALPNISFVASDTTTACTSKTVTFTATVTQQGPAPLTYLWDFGNGASSTQANPTYTYTTAGNYTVAVVVTNGAGCVGSATRANYIKVRNKPKAQFSYTRNSVCNPPVTFTFSNSSTGSGPLTYSWDFGDGTTSTATSPTKSYAAFGTYAVRLVVQDGVCSDTMTQTVTAAGESATPDFTVPTGVCVNAPATFTNTSTPAPTSVLWNFDDGTTSTALNPSKTYTAAGTYTVTLTNYRSGCTTTISKPVTVSPAPVASFTANKTSGCTLPLAVAFTNTSTGAASYLWNFGDGGTSTQTSPSHNYAANGAYSVTLTAISAAGCSTTSAATVIRVGAPTATLAVSGNACPTVPLTFTVSGLPTQPGISYAWTFGDGGTATTTTNTTTHPYATAGTRTAQVTATLPDGCTSTATAAVTVGTKILSAFTVTPRSACVNVPLTFSATNAGATSYTWSFFDGTGPVVASGKDTTHAYGAPGVYDVRLVVNNNGCRDTTLKIGHDTITGPTAQFTNTFSCADKRTQTFVNTSQGATSYAWNFGDGGTSILANPTYTYNAYGVYTVTLTATSGACSATATKVLRLFNIDSSFTASTTAFCANGATTFTLNDTTGIQSVKWQFGDGDTSGVVSPRPVSHTYRNIGNYSVTLTVTDSFGCTKTATRTNYITVGGVVANFSATPRPPCLPGSTTFTDLSTVTGSTIASRTWYFGDGSAPLTGNVASPSHTYTAAGSYDVSLVVVDGNGCRDSVTKAGYIKPANPVASFTVSTQARCVGELVPFVNTSTNATSFIWDFGDGTTTTDSMPTKRYATAGNYAVRLIAIGAGGCRDTTTTNVNIRVLVGAARFTMSDSVASCPPLAVQLTADTTTPAGTQFNWDFGNGNTSTARNPSVVYSYPGIYTVRLIATTPSGCKDTFRRTVQVYGPTGTLTYGPLLSCAPLAVNFTANGQSTNSVTYDFNDGTVYTTTAANSTTTHTYLLPGKYVPKIILGSLTGCRIAVVGTDTIQVGTVKAGFSYTPAADSACVQQQIRFVDTSRSTAGALTGRLWNFGDGTTSTLASPFKSFTTAGTYTVRLIAIAGSCRDTAYHTFTINPKPTLTVTGGGIICAGTSTQLTATGAATYQWTPAASLSNPNIANPVASPTAPTTYTVLGTSAQGCTNTAQVLVDARPKPRLIVSPDVAICSGTSTQLTASGATVYKWTPATGLSDTTIANPVANPASTTHYRVIGSYVGGLCADTAYVTVTVNQTPNMTVSRDTTICSGNTVALQVTGADTFAWTPTTGLSNPNIANPLATPLVTTTYTVVGTNTAGNCTATKTVTITVKASPVINAGHDTTLCPGQTYTIRNVGAADSLYTWTPSTNLSCANCPSPTVSTSATPGTQMYVVTAYNKNGCRTRDTVNITSAAGVTLAVRTDTTICSGRSVQLTTSGATSYAWKPGASLSDSTIASPIATPLATTTYKVIGMNAAGCSDTDSVKITVNPSPIVRAGNNFNLCFGSSAQLNATGATSYVWTPAAGLSCTTCANPVANPTAPVTYTVVGTDNGCTDTARVSIYIIPKPTITATASQTTICYGQTINLTATGANSYAWDPTLGVACATCPNTTAQPNATRTYRVVGAAANGCTDTAYLPITVNPLPIVRVQPDTATICEGQGIRLVATGGATYSWTPATGLSNTNSDTTFASPLVNTIYQVTGRSTNGCIATAQSSIKVSPRARVRATADDTTICEGTSTNLHGFGALNYEWYPATGLSCTNCANPVASPVITTTYRVIGAGVSLCPDTSYIKITVKAKPDLVVLPGAATICVGASVPLNATSTVGGRYSWTPATGLSCSTCPNPVAQPDTTTTYTLTLTADNGCTSKKDVVITVKPLPNVSAGPDRVICTGVPTQLNATGASAYVWSPATGLSCTTCKDPFVTIQGPATYVVTGTDVYGCTNTDTLNLTTTPHAGALGLRDTTLCIGSSIRLQATGGTSYLWSPASSLSNPRIANPTASPTQTTTYRVAIDNAGCYTDTLSVKITVVPLPVVNAGPDVNVASGASVNLNGNVPTDVVKYYWTPVDFLSCNDCLNPVSTPLNTITYTLHGISNYGCEGTDEVTLFTKCNSSQIFMPNTFTPNGDGQNDRFYPRGTGMKIVSSLRIFNRWGEQVFEAQNINLNDEYAGWDGTFKNMPLKPDTYVWMLEGNCESGDPISLKGDISIIR